MSTITEEVDLDAQEVWELVIPGQVFVEVKDPRHRGSYTQRRVGGNASRRVQLSVEERLFNQGLVAYGHEDQDVFTNGMMIRILPKTEERGEYELTDAELVTWLTEDDDDQYDALIREVDSEIILRRMLTLAEKKATKWRYDLLENLIRDRYLVSKSSKVAIEEEVARERAGL